MDLRYVQMPVEKIELDDIGAKIIVPFNGQAVEGWLSTISSYAIAWDKELAKKGKTAKRKVNLEIATIGGTTIKYGDLPQGFLVQVEREEIE